MSLMISVGDDGNSVLHIADGAADPVLQAVAELAMCV
jgi:hypothetical protein